MTVSAVWVTRSEPGASQLAARLRGESYSVIVEPVVAIEAVAPEVPSTDPVDFTVVVSAHAVREGLDRIGGEVIAVGKATAGVLEAHGIRARYPTDARSEGILEMFPSTDLSGVRVRVLKGVGGRSLLENELARRGADVEVAAVYRRVARGDVRIQPSEIGSIVVSSGDGFRIASRVWFDASGPAGTPVVVPSARVADVAHASGFSNVHVCDGASPEAVLAALRRIRDQAPS